jgi:hypothetical protein
MAGERSPNYPIISLPDAVARVQAIYERERQHLADREVVAKALGFGSLNGASRGIISALRKFGLLAEEGDQLKVSTEALDVILHSTGNPLRASALQKALILPPLFSELRATFGATLPSDENMRAYLIKRGFNPNTVSNVIRSYRDSVSMVEIESRGLEGEAAPEPMRAEPEAAAAPARQAVRGVGAITMFPHAPAEAAAAESELAFRLADNCHARITFTGEVTVEALEKLKAFLDLSMDVFPHRQAAPAAAEEELEPVTDD